MKAGWEVRKLDDVCDLITCGVAARPDYTEVGIPFLSAKNVKDGKIIWSGYNCISEVTHKELTKHNKPLVGDILYTRVGSFGEAAVIEEDKEFSVFVSLTLIKPKKDLLNNYFLKHYLNSSEVKELAKRSISSSGVGNLNVGTVRAFPIALPNLDEQQRIVAILDQAFEGVAKARANAEQNLKNARALFESHLQSVFTQRGEGWVNSKLGEVVELDKTQHKPNNALPYVGMEDIESDTGIFIGSKEPRKVKSNTFHFNQSHVLYGRLRPYLNKVLLPDFEGHCSTEVFPIFPTSNLDRSFLFYWLTLNSTKEKIDATCTGTRMPRANMNDVLTFDFSYPSINDQRVIVESLKELAKETQRLEALYQRKVACLDELKKSLLQQAFAGEL